MNNAEARIERVAIAICEGSFGRYHWKWDVAPERNDEPHFPSKRSFKVMARDAISAAFTPINPKRKKLTGIELAQMHIGELNAHIAELEATVRRLHQGSLS